MFRKYPLMHFPFLIKWIISLPEVGMKQVQTAAMTNLSSSHQNDTAKDKVEPAFPQGLKQWDQGRQQDSVGFHPCCYEGETKPAGSLNSELTKFNLNAET